MCASLVRKGLHIAAYHLEDMLSELASGLSQDLDLYLNASLCSGRSKTNARCMPCWVRFLIVNLLFVYVFPVEHRPPGGSLVEFV